MMVSGVVVGIGAVEWVMVLIFRTGKVEGLNGLVLGKWVIRTWDDDERGCKSRSPEEGGSQKSKHVDLGFELVCLEYCVL